LLGDYKARLEREKFTGFGQERIEELDREIESLIQQERALFLIEEKGMQTFNFMRNEYPG